ncbi:Sts1 protein [Starmerella bacillaris]|uniref:Tethering factor for nuclear proteasome STS1 n=1 Tax=Starmerella bacillaris TaxID=1247836 RepID=A0AAV5RJJ9_STABA|nr:Sts1 protein [Starmerella bacillaris]
MMGTPRHRLNWDETIRPKPSALYSTFNSLSLSPENKRKRRNDDSSPPPANNVHKRARPSKPHTSVVGLKRRMEALDQRQLVSILERLVERQPEISTLVEQMAPKLTVQQALDQLKKYLANVLENMPLGSTNANVNVNSNSTSNSNLTTPSTMSSSTGSNDYAFLRVRPFWTQFFVALADYTMIFVYGDEETSTALEFLHAATSLVHDVPRWASSTNNALLYTAYTELTQAWIKTLEKANTNASFAYLTGQMWESRFQEHCVRSSNIMIDGRIKEHEHAVMPRVCQTVIS